MATKRVMTFGNQYSGTAGPTFLPQIAAQEGPEGIILSDEARRGENWAAFFFAIFWIPMVACFTVIMVVVTTGATRPAELWFPRLFIIPFWLVSLGVIAYFGRRLLIRRKLAPPTLTVRRWPLALGSSSEVIYRRTLRGGGEVQGLEATLECVEWVRYRAGTDIRVATHTLFSRDLPIATVVPSVEQAEGRWTIEIPADLPPSFASADNQLLWRLRVTIRVAGTPADSTPFLLLVRPDRAD